MIKGEISGSAKVDEERHPDYKQGEERFISEQPEDLQYFHEADGGIHLPL